MSKVFGRDRADSAGGENRFSSVLGAQQEGENPPETQNTGLNLNSVVRAGFNQALDDAKKADEAAKAQDNSTAWSATTSLVGGFGKGIVDIVHSPFRKSKDQLEREAKYGGISALNEGGSFSAGLTRTAGDVAKVATTLNPITSEGRNNIGLAWDKYQTSLTTGTLDSRMNVVGQTAAFVVSLGIGGSQASKVTRVADDLRAVRIASTGVNLSDDVGRMTSIVGRTGEAAFALETKAGTIGEHAVNAARMERTVLPRIAAETPTLGTRLIAGTRNSVERARVFVADTIGLGAPAVTGETGTLGSAARMFGRFLKTEARETTKVSTGQRFFTHVDDTVRALDGGVAKTVRGIGDDIDVLLQRGGHSADDARALTKVKNIATDVARGKAPVEDLAQALKGLPKGNSVFENLSAKVTHLDEFTSQSARALTQKATRGALDDLSNHLSALERGLAPGPKTEALADIRAAATALADGTGDAQKLAQAIERAGKSGLNIDDILVKADDLNSIVQRAPLAQRVEQGMLATGNALDDMSRSLDDVMKPLRNGSDEFKQVEEVKRLSQEVANGAAKQDELIAAIRNLEGKVPGVTARTIDDLTESAVKLERAVTETRLAASLDNAVAGVRTSLDEVSSLRLVDKAGREFAEGSDEFLALKNVKEKAAELARGTGTKEELARALDELKKFDQIKPEVLNQITRNTAKFVDNLESARLMTRLDDALQPVRKSLSDMDNAVASVRTVDPAEAAKIEKVISDFVAGRTTNIDDVKQAFQKVNADGRFTAQIDELGRAVNEARPVIKLEQSITNARHAADDAIKVTDDIIRRYAEGTPQHRAVTEVKAAFDGASRGTVTAEELTETIARNARYLDDVKPGAAERLTQNARKLTEAVSDTVRLTGIRNGADDIVRISDDLIRQVGDDLPKVRVLEDLKAAARGVGNGTRSADDLKAAMEKVREAGITPQALGAKVDDLSGRVAQTERLVTIEKGIETGRQLASRVERYADDMERVVRQTSPEFKSIKNVKDELARATTSDDVVRVIRQNEDVLERIQPGSTKTLIEQISRGGDNLTSAGGRQAVRNVGNSLDEMDRAVQKVSSEFKAVEDVRAALRGVRETGFGDELVAAVNKPVLRAIEQKAPLAADDLDIVGAVTRFAEKPREVVARVERYADDMERVVRQTAPEFQSIQKVRDAISRAATKDELVSAIKQNSQVLDNIKPGSAQALLDDVARVGDDLTAAGARQSLSGAVTKLDDLERAARGASTELKAIEQLRQAARTAGNTGVVDELAAAANNPALRAIESKAHLIDDFARRAPRAADDIDIVQTAANLGKETANTRRLTTVENSLSAARNSIDNLIDQTNDATRNLSLRSQTAGRELAQDVRKLAEKADDAGTRQRLLNLADDLDNRAGTYSPVQERLKVIRSLTDDLAEGKIKDTHVADFVRKSNLDDIKSGATRSVETHVSDIADARKLTVLDDTTGNTQRLIRNLNEEVARLPVKGGNFADDVVEKAQAVRQAAQRVDEVSQRFMRGEASAVEVGEASERLARVAAANKQILPQLQTVEKMADEMASAARNLHAARGEVFHSQFVRLEEALVRGGANAHKQALENINHIYAAAATPELKGQIVKLRDLILDHQAVRTVLDQGFAGDKMLSRIMSDARSGGSTVVLPNSGAALNTRPVLGIVTDRGKLFDAIERIARRADDQSAFRIESGRIAGLTNDPIVLLRDPALRAEQARRQLRNDIIASTFGIGLTGLTTYGIYEKAKDAVRDIKLAPFRIAQLMEAEASATSESERQFFKTQLQEMLAEHTRGKSEEEVEDLRRQVSEIIEARARSDQMSQAVWRRRMDEAAISPALIDAANRAHQRSATQFETLDEEKAYIRHSNQVQYGNPMGPGVGPGAPVVVESVQPVVAAHQPRVRVSTGTRVNEGDKVKTATTGFDIARIRELSNIYNPASLRSAPFGSPLSAGGGALSSTKPWQTAQSNLSRRLYSGENAGRGLYGQFTKIEDTQDERDRPGAGGGSQGSDPDQGMTVVAARTAAPGQDEDNSGQNNQSTTTV